MKIRPSIVIVENNKLLLMRYNYGGQDVFNLPGGNAEEMETLADILARELDEELKLEVEVDDLLLLGETMQPEKQRTVLHAVFLGKIKSGNPVLNPMETSALEIVWKPIDELDQLNMYPNVGLDLQSVLLLDIKKNPYVGKIDQKWF